MLDSRNAQVRTSTLRQKLGLVPQEGPKPNFNSCMYKLTALSNDDLVALGEHIAMTGIRSIQNNHSMLLQLYLDNGGNLSQAQFFAFRNILGKYNR